MPPGEGAQVVDFVEAVRAALLERPFLVGGEPGGVEAGFDRVGIRWAWLSFR